MEPARCSLVSSYLETKYKTEILATLWITHLRWVNFARPARCTPSMKQGTDAYNSKANGARKLCVITGGTSGIGCSVVARLLADWQNYRIIVVARPSPRISQLRTLPGASERLSVVNGDLSSLGSIAKACDQIQGMLGSDRIDVLGLNAGVQIVRGNASSAEGLEPSFAVNFLAHFLIVERLKGLLRPGGRIVFTSSEVHDPDAFCLMGITRATWQDPLLLADPVRSQDHVASPVDRGEARYCASKVIGLMYVRHLARALPGVSVLAFNSSDVPATEIARDCNGLQRTNTVPTRYAHKGGQDTTPLTAAVDA